MLIFGCAQDDTQRVEQEGVCACTRAPPTARRFFRMIQVFRSSRTVHAYDAYLRLIAAKSEKFRFLADTKKKAAPKMQARRERTRGCVTRVFSRARSNHTTNSAQQGDDHRSRCSTPTHPHTHTRTHTLYTLHERTYTYAAHKGHTRTWNTYTRSFGQNLKDTSRKKVQVYHVAP